MSYYPEEGNVGLVEFLLDAPAPEEPMKTLEGLDEDEEASAGTDEEIFEKNEKDS